MHRKPTHSAQHNAGENPPGSAAEEAADAQRRIGHQIVQHYGLPAPGIAAA